ncbi:hypothetical protein [Aporhodopirellula aestuarii]|uniref:Uncharacterized protein n=1 Tax=Aporhodopirellula aestuarii TaxID=2950107 RepID=A0ABT0U0D4_9BACT|nr:hypothetical protein [Aporhodopirellula aestuarii]MCM2370353.1 hypothetical protein [Aporhodopirellula aestuarii]
MNRIIPLGLLAAAAIMSLAGSASAFGPCCCFCQEGRCQVTVEREEVETKEFVCECEAICIPPLRFPWECGPLKKCGKVRCVKTLGSVKGKETICVYDWSAIHCCPSCRSKLRGCCGNGCNSGCCDSVGYPCEISTESCCAEVKVPNLNEANDPGFTAEAEAFAKRYPDVSVAVFDAINNAKPEADGWISLSNHSADTLAADVELIEATR